MPSLRRTASSPAVRSSPYRYSSSQSSSTSLRKRGHRRPSVQTAERRVLADIDWWKVTEGQCGPNADGTHLDGHHSNVVEDLLDAAALVNIDASVGLPSTIVTLPWDLDNSFDHDSELLHPLPTEQFAALAISPSTPTCHGRESSSSSVESSPTCGETILEDIFLELEMGFMDSTLPPLPIIRRAPRKAPALSLARSFTFADTFSLRADISRRYADFAISPLSSAPTFFD